MLTTLPSLPTSGFPAFYSSPSFFAQESSTDSASFSGVRSKSLHLLHQAAKKVESLPALLEPPKETLSNSKRIKPESHKTPPTTTFSTPATSPLLLLSRAIHSSSFASSLATVQNEATFTKSEKKEVTIEQTTNSSKTENNKEKIPQEIHKLEQFIQREVQLLAQLKLYYCNDSSDAFKDEANASLIEEQSRKLAQELGVIMENKRVSLSVLMPSLMEIELKEPRAADEEILYPCSDLLTIARQPSEVAVANRYLLPAPEVVVSSSYHSEENCTLGVAVKLCYHTSGKEVASTLQGKQEVLQGIKQVNVDKTGRATFGKLKIMEVSSKHKHQSFCLLFSLEEYSAQGSKRILGQVQSAPFHVQSRPAKRKRETTEQGSEPAVVSEDSSEDGSFTTNQNPKKICKKSSEERILQQQQDCNYIYITDLLTLPQKEAAKKLGISESMLCKRFKECTRRKWPYRYLRKIDKVINMLNLHKTDGVIPKDDQEKLQRLKLEREECLRPVKIRITSYDRMSPLMRLRSKTPDYDEDNDIPIDALETLEMLKTQTRAQSPHSDELNDSDTVVVRMDEESDTLSTTQTTKEEEENRIKEDEGDVLDLMFPIGSTSAASTTPRPRVEKISEQSASGTAANSWKVPLSPSSPPSDSAVSD